MSKYELSLKKKILEIIEFRLKEGISNYGIALYLDDIPSFNLNSIISNIFFFKLNSYLLIKNTSFN